MDRTDSVQGGERNALPTASRLTQTRTPSSTHPLLPSPPKWQGRMGLWATHNAPSLLLLHGHSLPLLHVGRSHVLPQLILCGMQRLQLSKHGSNTAPNHRAIPQALLRHSSKSNSSCGSPAAPRVPPQLHGETRSRCSPWAAGDSLLHSQVSPGLQGTAAACLEHLLHSPWWLQGCFSPISHSFLPAAVTKHFPLL